MKVTLQPAGHVLELLPGERIIDAARRLGFDAPQSCRNGNCHICAANLISGRVSQQGEERTSGELFTCIAEPLQDCELIWDGVLAPGELPLQRLACQVIDCTNLGADVWRLRMRTPAGKALRYHAGQYLLLTRPDGEAAAFSIASSPDQQRELELHILNRDSITAALINQLQQTRMAQLQLPFGHCHIADLPTRPMVMIAAGTGLAQMQSLIQDASRRGFNQPMHLYWGARQGCDLYQPPYWSEWQQLADLTLHKVISHDPDWSGRNGLLYQAIIDDLGDLSRYEFYVSGSPAMVYATFDALIEGGMPAAQMHADAFAYAPRD